MLDCELKAAIAEQTKHDVCQQIINQIGHYIDTTERKGEKLVLYSVKAYVRSIQEGD